LKKSVTYEVQFMQMIKYEFQSIKNYNTASDCCLLFHFNFNVLNSKSEVWTFFLQSSKLR